MLQFDEPKSDTLLVFQFPVLLDKGAGSGMAGMAAAIPIQNWYGDAIPIKSKAANLFIICNKSRIKTSAFYMFLSHEF